MTGPLLVGDIGGTSVRFGLVKPDHPPTDIQYFRKWSGSDFASFDDAVGAYINDTGERPQAALFGIAGPVQGGKVELVNRPDWPVVDSACLAKKFGIQCVHMVNDFATMARAVPELDDSHITTISPGQSNPDAPILVAGAGTGFGVATLLPGANGKWQIISGEGGHSRFAAQTATEAALVAHLQASYDYVSNELICGGTNLATVHAALCAVLGEPYEDCPHEEILQGAQNGNALFRTLCTIRAGTIMGAIGDLALINGTLGGVFLAGGVSQRLQDYFTLPTIADRFLSRGSRSNYVRAIPINLIQSEIAPLIGAAALYFERYTNP